MSKTLPDKQRMDFFDAMRGFTMFLVVFMHTQGVWFDYYPGPTSLVARFRMPLFFFVSGFFSYSAVYDRPKFVKRMKNRFQMQLVPTIVIGAVYCLMLMIVNGGGGYRYAPYC